MLFLRGIGALVITLALFSLFSLRFPKGGQAMSGLANAAVASFLVEAIFKYILGDFAGLPFFEAVGSAAGSMGGPAAGVLVGTVLGMNPVYALAGGIAVAGYGIIPGFFAAYVMYFVIDWLEEKMPQGLDMIVCTLVAAAGYYGIATLVDPAVNVTIEIVGGAITAATDESPLLMGFVLGGIMKIVCTSPLSSMALTAMLHLTGLPMGIADIACFGGAFTNGIIFHKLHFGDRSNVIAVMLEPLTQAEIITKNPLPIYTSSFLGGSLAGVGAAALGIICNAPGTASQIPGALAPFAFNPPLRVLAALVWAAIGGTFGGLVVANIMKKIGYKQVE